MKPVLANLMVPRVKIHLDDRDWPLIFNFNVLCRAEELTGRNLLTDPENNLGKPSAITLRAILYLCLKEQGAKYSLEEVGQLINPGNQNMLYEALLNAYVASKPDQKEVEADTAADPIRQAS